jgi:hypothetical protein
MPKPAQSYAVYGTSADDNLQGTSANENFYAYAGNDVVHGGGGNDQLMGHEGDDSLYGDDGNDTLFGQEGNDFLYGGAGSDTLWWGGFGHDELDGGTGSDIFVGAAWEWTNQQVGTVLITDFQTGIDKLDLTRFDANENTAPGVITGNKTPGNDAFRVVTATKGGTPGDMVITTGVDELGRPITIVLGYTDTVAGADIEIHLLGTTATGGAIIGPQDIWL